MSIAGIAYQVVKRLLSTIVTVSDFIFFTAHFRSVEIATYSQSTFYVGIMRRETCFNKRTEL